jgi:hypothetical protein
MRVWEKSVIRRETIEQFKSRQVRSGLDFRPIPCPDFDPPLLEVAWSRA